MESNAGRSVRVGKDGEAYTADDYRRPTPSEQSGCDACCGRQDGVLQSAIGDLDTSFLDFYGKRDQGR